MKLFDMYSYLIANWINGGNFISRKKIKATDICADYNIIFTRTKAKKVYAVTGIKPENVDLCFLDYIRDSLFRLHPDIETIINVDQHPVHIDINNDKFTRAMSKAAEMYNSYRGAFESQSPTDRLTGKTYKLPNGGRLRLSSDKLDNLKQVYVSYRTLYEEVTAGNTLSLVKIFIEVSGTDVKEVKKAGYDIFGILGSLSIGCTEVRSATKSYYLDFGPAAPTVKVMNKKFLPQLLFTEDNTTAFSSYKMRGLVGDGDMLFGVDRWSRLPFCLDMFSAPSAQVFLLLGKTGSGKTFSAFQIALSALARGEYVTAIDIKGREWSLITQYTKSKTLTFDDRNPSFVNTLRLDDMFSDGLNYGELYNTAVKGTVTLLMLIVNLQAGEGNASDLELVLREAVMKLYSMNNVDVNNPVSFKNSKHLTYSDILPILETLSNTTTYSSAQKQMVTVARSRCHAYLGDSGIFAEAFRNEITLSDVLSAPLVIYEFNKNQGAMTDSLDVIRIFMVQFLDSKKKAMLKLQKKFLFCFYEELQRCEQFGNLLEYICAEVTGSRSNNALIFLLMNSLAVLQGPRAQDIRSNITSYIVGNSNPGDIRILEEDFNQAWVASQLRLFEEHVSNFRNCFAASIDTGKETYQTVYKVELPANFNKSLRTRTIKEDISVASDGKGAQVALGKPKAGVS